MADFAYNNAKNANIDHTLFKLNYGYHLCVFFKNKYDARSRSFLANELATKLRELINIYCQNILPLQELQKQAYDKGVNSQSCTLGKKVWFNNKHIKIKQN